MFLCVWLALTGGRRADLPAGVLTALAATWASLRLQPPMATRLNLAALARLALRFLWGSLVAGVDVARRALSPRLALRPGLLFYSVRLPHGPARDAFRAIMSLQPGTLPTEDEARDGFLIHCLDTDADVLAVFAAEEAAFARAAGITLPSRTPMPGRRSDG
nr:Na+/H+ antiporter subunit E [Ancylobacter gelatini]